MTDSFKYMFKDDCFWKKYLAVLCIVFVSNCLINGSGLFSPAMNNGQSSVWYNVLFFSGLVIMFIPYGYSISLLKARLEGANSLPSLNILSDFTAGLKVFVSALLLILLLAVAAIIISFVNVLLSTFGSVFSLICSVVLFFMLLIVSFFGIAMCCRYVKKPSYLNFLNFKAAAQLINCDTAKYFKAYLLTLLCTVIVYSIAMLSVIYLSTIGYLGLIIYCIAVSVIWTYYMYVLAGIFEKAVIADNI